MDVAYKIELLSDFKLLSDFNCGVKPMDDFIHSDLEIYTKNHYCSTYCVKASSGKVAALFALSFDSIILDPDDFEDINIGASETDRPKVDEQTRSDFENKYVYPALEIAYLAVDSQYQKMHLGSAIIEEIVKYAKT